MTSVFEEMQGTAGARHREFVEEYKQVLTDALNLTGVRNEEDYNQLVALPDYFAFGDTSYCHMIYLKALRAINQIMSGSDPEDSLLDLINYTGYTLAKKRLDEQSKIESLDADERKKYETLMHEKRAAMIAINNIEENIKTMFGKDETFRRSESEQDMFRKDDPNRSH